MEIVELILESRPRPESEDPELDARIAHERLSAAKHASRSRRAYVLKILLQDEYNTGQHLKM